MRLLAESRALQSGEDDYHLATLVRPALFAAADALAADNEPQVAAALGVLTALLRRGGHPITAEMATSSFSGELAVATPISLRGRGCSPALAGVLMTPR